MVAIPGDRRPIDGPGRAVGIRSPKGLADGVAAVPRDHWLVAIRVEPCVHDRRCVVGMALAANQQQRVLEVLRAQHFAHIRAHAAIVMVLVERAPGQEVEHCDHTQQHSARDHQRAGRG